MKIIFINVKRALSRSGLPDLDYALNPYMGCYHGCIYCYARLYTWINEIRENWGEIVAVKKNLINVLEKEIKYFRKGVVGVGTITDPYQPVEAIYELTRRSIELLLRHGFHVSIQTKNTLILRDTDLLTKHRDNVDVGFTITSLNNKKSRLYEPRASPPSMRAYALKQLSIRGIDTWIFYGPVIPGYNDDLDTRTKIIELARETGSRILIDSIHVKKFMYNKNHPLHQLIPIIRNYPWKRFLSETIKLCREYNVECIPGFAEPSKKESTLDSFMH
ncbi:SPL family radical SAM protein [Staphylothermus hellenicus]|uniref:Radical SAM domain protein n=1 Tax=Staphylothermus hellenicus (strain DSM 12710 / JCM 10830 / BK20S6-10-b1 / P8) TaxID=591019 RepID=D7DBP1_STAHD|nr:radical SAM protein [Staphylothermus hellenicus]ADI31588.1 Radical SAM domain protein [Staphylothermus hellenicus DSM 12710]